ncbi:MAG TPA: glycosyltransferase family 2 protein [Patescibacteria group bacterium]
MKVSMVIPVYNEEKYLANCLDSVFAQNEKPDEVIIVDNNSIDNTVAIAKKYPVILLHEKKQGITPARNAGFNAAQYDIIARTDADTILPKDWITRVKKAFAQNPKLVGFSGPAHYYHVPEFIQLHNWPNNFALNRTFRQALKHDCLFGPNMAIRKDAWEKIKDETCPNDADVHEDVDLAIHIARLGEMNFDKTLIVESSPRRFQKLEPYFEYPYRFIKTLQKHEKSLLALRANPYFIKKLVPKHATIKRLGKTSRELIKKYRDKYLVI